ncbi:MAG TPA: serine kinase [Cyanobacteria bacterium UBA8803]|nr:serine kinase [Cyanobacteria bacterium UBA9273]HBL60475.1 serine kinase [Cyanobacteria bacterium UBA8803]
MFSYTAYGLGIHSTLPLPALTPGATNQDIVIRKGNVDRTVSETANQEDFVLRADAKEVCFAWDKVGACLVRDGREIVVDIESGVDEQLLPPFIMVIPLAMLLHQRGLLILHASAVVINGGVIAFLGKSGQGKSTTAGALHQLGYPIVTDDVLALDITDTSGVTVFPSFPQLRLWPESAVSLGNAPETLPPVFPNSEKRLRHVTEGFQQTPLPLKQIYVLEYGSNLEIEPLKSQEAFIEVTRQSYPGKELLKATNTAAAKFQLGAKLANSVSVCRLRRPRSLSTLSDLARFVENAAGS